MTREECKKYLEQYRPLKLELDSMEKLKAYQLKLILREYKMTSRDKFSPAVVNLFKIMDDTLVGIQNEIHKIEFIIGSIEDEEIRKVMELRFIQNKTVLKTADIVFRSDRSISRMSSRGLGECIGILENR